MLISARCDSTVVPSAARSTMAPTASVGMLAAASILSTLSGNWLSRDEIVGETHPEASNASAAAKKSRLNIS